MFAHSAGWAINTSALKLRESQQRMRVRSFSLGITEMKELVGSEMPYVSLTDIDPMLEKSIKNFYGMLEQENQINNLLRLNLFCIHI